MDELEILQPPRGFEILWSRPGNVRVVQTTRFGGASHAPYGSLNLAGHVGDSPRHVAHNRARVARWFNLPGAPYFLSQVHGTQIAHLEAVAPGEAVEADGAVSATPGQVAAILTADCLPILLTTQRGERIGALHGGWRGLCGGVIEAGLEAMATAPDAVLAWIGPGIGASAYRVDRTVVDAACARHPWAERFATPVRETRAAEAALAEIPRPMARSIAGSERIPSVPAGSGAENRAEAGAEVEAMFEAMDASIAPSTTHPKDQYQFDLAGYAAAILHAAGVQSVTLSGACTARTPDFFSHRQEGTTGRMATLIWLAQD